MKDVTLIRSIPVSHAENSVPALFFSGRLKVIRHVASEFDVCEIDLLYVKELSQHCAMSSASLDQTYAAG